MLAVFTLYLRDTTGQGFGWTRRLHRNSFRKGGTTGVGLVEVYRLP